MNLSGPTIDVERVARLARLLLDPEELEAFRTQIRRVVEHVAQLEELDTEAVSPTSHPIALDAPLRDDTEKPSLPREEALANAVNADRDAGAFVVPRFVEGG